MMKLNKIDIYEKIIVIIGILLALTIFLPTLAFLNDGTQFSGIELVFGSEFANIGSWASGNIHTSILGILAYLLPLAAVFCILYVKKGYLYSIGLFTSSLVLLFLLPDYLKISVTILNSTSEINVEWSTLFGQILAQILAVAGLIASLLKMVELNK